MSACRQTCPFWGTRRGCRKGKKCPLLHDNPHHGNAAHIPHISRHGDSFNLRPPLTSSLDMFFKEHKRPMPLSTAKFWSPQGSDTELVTFAVLNLTSPNMGACAAARQQGGVTISDQWRGLSTADFSGNIMHGTSVENAMQILLDGGATCDHTRTCPTHI